MKLQHFTTRDEGNRITSVAFVAADHPDPAKRTEWIDVQISVELPTAQNGAFLRTEVLRLVRDKLDELAEGYRRLSPQ